MKTKRLHRPHYTLPLFFPLALILFFLGCNKNSDELPLLPPVTHPLARDYIGYGVVDVSFTHLLNEPGGSGASLGYLRKGTVVRILERKPLVKQGNAESWVFAEGNYQGAANASAGWLPESVLEIYDNESRAHTASKTMNQ